MLFYPAFLLNWIFQVPLNWFRNNSRPKPQINQSTIGLAVVFQPGSGKMAPFSEEKPSKLKIES
jgi:hypothetical protein